jgi:hypothetical protein
MDWNELLNTLANQVAFWQKNNPTSSPLVNNAKNTIKDIGRVADDYVGGGMGQAALRGPDALSRQLLLNTALYGASAGIGAGIGAGSAKLTPKIAALRQWIKPRDIGVHISPFDDLQQILPNININKGAGEIPGFPLIEGQTYKLSSTNAYNQKLNPNELLDSVENYLPNVKINPMGNKNIYVTKSTKGLLDPEHQYYVDMYNNGSIEFPGSVNARMTPSQTVIGSKTINALQEGNKLGDELKNELAKLIAKQQSLEKVKSVGRGAVVGGSAVGTALTPLAVAKPALGFNNKNKNNKK